MTNVAEDVVFALVGHVAGKVFAHDAVPIWRILLVKEAFDIFGNVLLRVDFVHNGVHLLLKVGLHLFGHLADHILNVSLRARHSTLLYFLYF